MGGTFHAGTLVNAMRPLEFARANPHILAQIVQKFHLVSKMLIAKDSVLAIVTLTVGNASVTVMLLWEEDVKTQ